MRYFIKIIIACLAIFGLIVTVLGALLTIFFIKVDPIVSYKEVFRTTSPDETMDAIIITTDGGATTSVVSSVYIVPKGMHSEKLYTKDGAIFIGYRAYENDIKIYWKNDNLYIQYSSGVELRKHEDYYGNYTRSHGYKPIIHVYTEHLQS